MGARGPKPLPANVHQLRGNASKKPLAEFLDEFRPEVEIPDFPSWIWPEAKKEWKRLSTELERYGLISKLDRAALVLYCQAWAKMVWAERSLTRAMKLAEDAREAAEAKGDVYNGGDGLMVRTANGNFTYSHHWVVGKHAASEVKRYLDLFGLSPSARSRVTTSDNRQGALFAEEGSKDKWDGL
ncbi:phage terminase, small subunit [Acidovorax sp. CF316]|uniref:P27 family phage terminase small subunit n=1 Tax=Acidovorax sp. CF316 TaxID=1144317 RepID=UPI00026BC7F5|nr:P27 family phage terminase small subunit [Acidovorax sp. CF316]EJE49586.1 phage terminase, small subunit [Acidovorax sp. CF316]